MLIIVVLFKLVRVQVYTYMFQKFIVKLPSTREVILLNSFYKRDTFFVTSTRELYCLIPSTRGGTILGLREKIYCLVPSTRGGIILGLSGEDTLLGSFYKKRYYSWSFGIRYIAWFLQQEVPPLLFTSTGGDYIACSLLQEEAHSYRPTYL